MPIKLSVLTPIIIGFLFGFALAWKIKPTTSGDHFLSSRHDVRIPSESNHPLSERAQEHIKQNQASKNIEVDTVQNTYSQQELEPEKQVRTQDPSATIKTLLKQQRFDAAIELYANYENHRLQANLKGIITDHLKSLRRDTALFRALIESYLSYDYADTGILMLNAEFLQSQQAYIEAALQYEYAFSYADTAQLQAQVRKQYRSFTTSIDTLFGQGENWQALLDFYQEIHSLNVNANAQRFREAELNLFLDNIALAEQQFTELLSDINFQSRAQDMLDLIAKNQSDFQLTQEWLALIPLTQHGQHYIAQLNISGSATVSLLLDTGASITSLSEGAFKRIYNSYDFSHIATHQFSTAAGVIAGEVYEVSYVELGDQVLHKINIVEMPIPETERVDGLLGMNILGQFEFHIDQERNLLKLKAKSGN